MDKFFVNIHGYRVYPNSDIYNKHGRKIKPRIMKDGTKMVRFYIDTIHGRMEIKRRLHVVMANAYHIELPVQFRDGNKLNCSLENLI